MGNIKDRVIQFIESQQIKKGDFFENIGMSSANFRGEPKKTPLNSTAIENIITHYPKLNLHWLVTGRGLMLNPPDNKDLHFYNPDQANNILHQRTNDYKDEMLQILIQNVKTLEREVEKLRNELGQRENTEV